MCTTKLLMPGLIAVSGRPMRPCVHLVGPSSVSSLDANQGTGAQTDYPSPTERATWRRHRIAWFLADESRSGDPKFLLMAEVGSSLAWARDDLPRNHVVCRGRGEGQSGAGTNSGC
jgi:hypothetical protein